MIGLWRTATFRRMRHPTRALPRRLSCVLLLGLLGATSVQASEREDDRRRHHLSTSLFMLANVLPMEDSPAFYQLNYGYRLTPRDVVIVEAITWRYHEPLGIPWGPSKGDPDESFPGHVRDIGLGLAYQRFVWEGAYSTLHATPFVQTYFDEAGEKIQTGFQLFVTLRFGYHFEFLDDRLFFEPSVAFTYWPVNTNLPDSFQVREDRWPNYFLFEPGLHVGVKL